VPLPERDDPEVIDVTAVAPRLGMLLVRDEQAGLAALGPASLVR
jgi:hypothetical protein